MKRRTYPIFAAAFMVAALVVPASPASAQEPCPEGSVLIPSPGFGAEFVCHDSPFGLFFCPPGFELQQFPIPNGIQNACVAVAQDGGDGQQGGGGQQGDGGGGAAAPLELSQETEQEAESGDVDQSFEVSQTGDNSNQCASPQGVANTGNPQNVTDLLQAASETDDFEFEEVGSTIDVSPTNTTDCTGEVNQAASASG